jgi:hypothetical protein
MEPHALPREQELDDQVAGRDNKLSRNVVRLIYTILAA